MNSKCEEDECMYNLDQKLSFKTLRIGSYLTLFILNCNSENTTAIIKNAERAGVFTCGSKVWLAVCTAMIMLKQYRQGGTGIIQIFFGNLKIASISKDLTCFRCQN